MRGEKVVPNLVEYSLSLLGIPDYRKRNSRSPGSARAPISKQAAAFLFVGMKTTNGSQVEHLKIDSNTPQQSKKMEPL